ncbi:Crp/Fnr family transcriptional regulator [Flavihumibacter stibioxidans]|uniref:Crp/Fnr family transcriptional regulator n=1 Tax=Flavihumibacter stibioxidans TaxID=1834163 RepID=A0ABR7MBS0_9BACT|nr:Crp/Fnr family transcriptional regulator [Flavihumibacter stibioxidans]MBC6492485.1 Crp/Fnr family transcriptional regulator [Flavihumibacter stibioxidans]
MSIRHLFQIDQWDFQSKSILADLPAEDWALISAHMTETELPKGHLLFREGSIPAGIHFIQKGKAKKYQADQDGHEQIIYVANTGELLGYHAVLSEDRYPDSCSLLEDSVIGFIPREDFMAALERSPLLSRRLLKTLSHEFTVLANSLSLFRQRSVRERTALQLVVLREKYKLAEVPLQPVEINLSREDLANMVGTARENVVRVLSDFKDEGLISTRGRKIIVLDVAGLIRVANFK